MSGLVVTKRKYIAEDDNGEGYDDVACPECEAIITVRFQRGRSWRRLRCPICESNVTVSIRNEEIPLIQLQRSGAE